MGLWDQSRREWALIGRRCLQDVKRSTMQAGQIAQAASNRLIWRAHPPTSGRPGMSPGGGGGSGATVHFVDAGIDTGPISRQEPVRVLPDDSEDTLSARILETEHGLYPQALDIVARSAYAIEGRTVRLL